MLVWAVRASVMITKCPATRTHPETIFNSFGSSRENAKLSSVPYSHFFKFSFFFFFIFITTFRKSCPVQPQVSGFQQPL